MRSALYHIIKQSKDHAHIKDVTMYSGLSVVDGVGMGQAVMIYHQADLDAIPFRISDDVSAELALFEAALEKTRADILRLKKRLALQVTENELALFDVYFNLLDKLNLGGEIALLISQGQWAQGALRMVIHEHMQHFELMTDDYLKERSADIKDLGLRVLGYLQEAQMVYDYPANTVLVADSISAADLADVPEDKLVAVVSKTGTVNSHVAILARAMGIPSVFGIQDLDKEAINGELLIVDGYYGHVYVSPTKTLIHEFTRLIAEEEKLNHDLAALRSLPAETLDGHRVDLKVNVGLAVDAGLSLSIGASGVGLYRSELAFMIRDRFPTEDEQYILYKQLLTAFAPRPVTIRTLDIGGDKQLSYFAHHEKNPYLGWRGIRVSLDEPDLFMTQIRALLRASVGHEHLSILLPMITSFKEIDAARHLIDKVWQNLRDTGLHIEPPKIGAMVEVPAAIYEAKQIAARVDFLSVGSNDLIQYLLAVDRNNSRVAAYYDTLHPAVLKALYQLVTIVHQQGKHVSVCGEMANCPVSALLLLGMGFDGLSMNSNSLLKIKWMIRRIALTQAQSIVETAMTLEDSTAIRFYTEQALVAAGLGNLIRAGK